MELERKSEPEHLSAKLFAIRSIPRNDGIEPLQPLQQTHGRIHPRQAQSVNSRARNRPYAVGKMDQRRNFLTHPNFRIVRFEKLKRGKTQNGIANSTWSNQQPSQAGLLRTLAGFKQRAVQILNTEMDGLGGFQVLVRNIEAGSHHPIHGLMRSNRVLDG